MSKHGVTLIFLLDTSQTAEAARTRNQKNTQNQDYNGHRALALAGPKTSTLTVKTGTTREEVSPGTGPPGGLASVAP